MRLTLQAEGGQARPQILTRKAKAVTDVDKRQDSRWALATSVKRRGAGLWLGFFPENGIIYELNLSRVFTAMGRFDVTVIVKETNNICSSAL